MNASRIADGRDRKTLRAAALEMHRHATAIGKRPASPRDERQGPPALRSAAYRDMARLLERLSKGSTCADAKRAALAASDGSPASRSASQAVLTVVNMLAVPAGIDPYEGDWTARTTTAA